LKNEIKPWPGEDQDNEDEVGRASGPYNCSGWKSDIDMFILERKMKIMLGTSWPEVTAEVQQIMIATSDIRQRMGL